VSRRIALLRGGRGRKGARGQNVDSLLDTMANVVGILVVLMAVTQMTVNDAMKRIQVWESEEAVALREDRKQAEASLSAMAGIDLARVLELSTLRTHIQRLRGLPAATDTASVSADVASQRLQVRRLRAAIADEREKLANLQILLSKSESRAEEEGIALRLPDPRPAPVAAEPMVLFCRYGRVFDPRFDQLTRELNQVARSAPRPVDRYFEAYDIGNELLRWRIIETATGRVHRLDWRRTTIGETAEQLLSPRAKFREVLATLAPGSKFLHFYVWGDSFEAYLEARRIAEEAGFSAGWIPIPAGKSLELVKGRAPPTPVD
jgi:hypothetical protein